LGSPDRQLSPVSQILLPERGVIFLYPLICRFPKTSFVVQESMVIALDLFSARWANSSAVCCFPHSGFYPV